MYRDVGDVCDFDFGLRVSQTGKKIYFTDEYTAKYRISDVAISNSKLNDSGLTAYLMVDRTPVPATSLALKNAWMRDRAGVAVGQAIANKKYGVANEIFFSKHHFRKIFTLGGLKRMFFLLWGRLASGSEAKSSAA